MILKSKAYLALLLVSSLLLSQTFAQDEFSSFNLPPKQSLIKEKQTCSQLRMGTDILTDEQAENIISSGVVDEKWSVDSQLHKIVGPTRELLQLYLQDIGTELTAENIVLTYTPEDKAHSVVQLVKEHPEYYMLEIAFKCNAYGATLISYNVQINIPGCGNAEIFFRKLCGNPYTERAGFTVEMEFGTYKETIVRNGKIVHVDLFDPDINEGAVVVPTSVDSVFFTMSMNKDDMNSSNSSTASNFQNNINQTWELKHNDTETFIPAIRAHSDENIIVSNLEGDITVSGGTVSDTQKQLFTLELECQGWKGQSTIELDILLQQFRSINLFFLKKCDGKNPMQPMHFYKKAWFWALVGCLALIGFTAYRNVKEKGHADAHNLPIVKHSMLLVRFIYLKATDFIQSRQLENGSGESKPQRLSYQEVKNNDADAEIQEMNDRVPTNVGRADDEEGVDFEVNLKEEKGGSSSGPKYGTF